ncbi:MAG: AAA family ATPase [Campylobacterales bacterium]|nr:AAA family ATPase [Campylobacterales bacterium]
MKEQTNLMHIDSTNIARMDSHGEYQRLFINNLIGSSSNAELMRARRAKVINIEVDNIEDIWCTLETKFFCYSIDEYRCIIIEKDFIATINWQFQSSFIGLYIIVTSRNIQQCRDSIKKLEQTLSQFILKDSTKVTYSILQNDNSETLNETFYQEILDVAYNPVATPFIDDVDDYIEKFLNSNVPVLILQGEPGTGKTTLVKYILKAMQERVLKKRDNFQVMYSFDENIFYMSDFYDYDVLVLEDINQVLHKNQDDGKLNPINKFLSVTDGLISKYKKIIITTNIESKHQINQALLRPGRCYDVIPFRKLEGIEIDNLCDSCAKDLNLQTESINLSEFYARCNGEQNSKMFSSRVGF